MLLFMYFFLAFFNCFCIVIVINKILFSLHFLLFFYLFFSSSCVRFCFCLRFCSQILPTWNLTSSSSSLKLLLLRGNDQSYSNYSAIYGVNVHKLVNVDIHRWMSEIPFFLSLDLVNAASQFFQFKARFDADTLG